MLDQQPVGFLAAAAFAVPFHAHQHPAAVQALAFEDELQVAAPQPLLRIADRPPIAAVPELHRAAAILALGDGALEVAIVERMILGLHRQPLDLGIERRPLGHRPRQEDTVELEPEIVVQARGIVPLDDKTQLLGGGDSLLARRLVRLAEVALGAIRGETVFAQRMQPIAFGRARYGLEPNGKRHLRRDVAPVTSIWVWATDPTSWPLVQV